MSKLLSTFSLRNLTLKNRVVLAPLTRGRAPGAIPNDLMLEYYTQRSGAGLIITEGTFPCPQGHGWPDAPGIYTEQMAAGWKKIVDAVHAKGSTIFCQLWHTGRASHSDFHDGKLAVSSSAVKIGAGPSADGVYTPKGKKPHEVPRALELSEIPQVVRDYSTAAKFAKDAGFDGVEIHSANGYLLDQFLQTTCNKRDDAYGGSIPNRIRLLKEVVEGVTSVLPAERVGVRISPNGVYNDMGSPDFQELFTAVARELDQHNLAYLHVMDGLGFGFHQLGEPMTLAHFRKIFRGPIVGNVDYTKDTAEKAIESGNADLIAFGRPFISNPDLVERFRNNWPLAPGDASTWFFGGTKGYADFPPHKP